MELRDQIMQIINGRSQLINCDLDKKIAVMESKRHKRLIDIVDKIWDEKGLNGRECKKS